MPQPPLSPMPGSLVQPGSDSLHPEAVPQTYLTASAGELSDGSQPGDWGYNAGIASGLAKATGATAGIPGAFTPAGSDPPNTPADLIAGRPVTVTASPATNWTVGQYVQTAKSGASGRAYWNGSAWVPGAHP